jgi:hypothetical protein
MTAEAKLRTLAQQDPVLQSYFFTDGQVRWFGPKLEPNYLKPGKACVRVRRISTTRTYLKETKTHRSVCEMAQPRFQIDVLDYNSERAMSAAAAICDWLATVDLSSNAQFGSPLTTPTRHPNQVLNQIHGTEIALDPAPHCIILDVRVMDLE